MRTHIIPTMKSVALSRSISLVRISHLLERKHTRKNTFLTSTRDLLLTTKPRMPDMHHLMSLTDPFQAHVEIGIDTGQELIRKNGKPLTTKEIERRRKISESKKGTKPWNKGRKHSEETIQRIKERTLEALSDPMVMPCQEKDERNASKKTREHLSAKHKLIWYERHKRKRYQDLLHGNWSDIIAAAAKIGGYGEGELDWQCDKWKVKIERKKKLEEEKKEREKRKKEREKRKKAREKRKKEREEYRKLQKILKLMKKKMAAEEEEKRRQKAGKVKLQQTARSHRFVKERLIKLHLWKKRLETVSNSKEIVPDSDDEWDIETAKKRMEIGIALLDQLQLVKDGRKTSKDPLEQVVDETVEERSSLVLMEEAPQESESRTVPIPR